MRHEIHASASGLAILCLLSLPAIALTAEPVEFRLISYEEMDQFGSRYHWLNSQGARGWELRTFGDHRGLMERWSPDARWEYTFLMRETSPLSVQHPSELESVGFHQALNLMYEQGWRIAMSAERGRILILSRRRREDPRPQTAHDLVSLEGVWRVTMNTGPTRPFLRIQQGVVTDASAEGLDRRPRFPRKYQLVVRPHSSPKEFDLLTRESVTPRVEVRGIYELDGDNLRIGIHAANPQFRPNQFFSSKKPEDQVSGDTVEVPTDMFELEKVY